MKNKNTFPEEYTDKIQEINEIYCNLAQQRDNTKSKVLMHVLNEEICAYVSLTQTNTKYLQLFAAQLRSMPNSENECMEDMKNLINTIKFFPENLKSDMTNKKIICSQIEFALSQLESYEQNLKLSDGLDRLNSYIIEFHIENYIKAASRNFKDWKKFVNILADLVANNIPLITMFKSVADTIKSIAELINEYENDKTDYSDIDKELSKIEIHIKVMNVLQTYYEIFIQEMQTNSEK